MPDQKKNYITFECFVSCDPGTQEMLPLKRKSSELLRLSLYATYVYF